MYKITVTLSDDSIEKFDVSASSEHSAISFAKNKIEEVSLLSGDNRTPVHIEVEEQFFDVM